jgi:hypothetical protein
MAEYKPDLDQLRNKLSREERAELKDMTKPQRLHYYVQRIGTGEEKKKHTRGETPQWAKDLDGVMFKD